MLASLLWITLEKCQIVCLQMSITLSLCYSVLPSVFGLRNITFHVSQGGSKTPESRTEQNPVKLKEEKRSWEVLSKIKEETKDLNQTKYEAYYMHFRK